ncbi:MAG TPA: tetratricopeptide repeat protein [Pseudomonadales bacterium]|nr:tetratricopeptide repeat protein [Pseudomonadales bacterium]
MNATPDIVEISIQNFQTEVVDKSKQVPILLEFYADEAEPSRQLAPVLAQLSREYGGKFVLARVNIRENSQLVQQLGVRTLPTVKVIFQGQMVQNLEGPQQEAQLRAMLDQLTMSPIEMIRQEIDGLLASGDRASAISLLQQAIAEEPKNYALQAELCDLLVMEDRIDEAKQILSGLPESTEGIERAKNRIEFIERARNLPPLAELASRVESNPDDLQARLDYAVRLVAGDRMEEALEALLTILKKDRNFGDDIARTTMIQVFDLLGKGNELATAYRRKMFTFLH